MDDQFLDSSKYELRKDTVNSFDIRSIEVMPIESQITCPDCPETIGFKKKDTTSHTILDIYKNKPIELTITRQRFVCKKCGKSITSSGDPYPQNCHISKDFGDFLVSEMINDSSLTYTKVEDRYGVSQTYASDALNSYEKENENKIYNLQPCYRLVFYPFEYERRHYRCCVCGTDKSNRNVILGIIDEYSVDFIRNFIREKIKSRKIIETVFCALVPDVVVMLWSEFPNSKVVINPISLKHRINALTNYMEGGLYNEKIELLNSLRSITRMQQKSYEEFYDSFIKWQGRINADLKEALNELVTDISDCAEECYSSSQYKMNEFDIEIISKIIDAFKKRNTPYKAMCIRVLFENSYIKKQFIRIQLQYILDFSSRPHRLKNYCIEIKMLPELFPDLFE